MYRLETHTRPNNIYILFIALYYGRPEVYKIYFFLLIINGLLSAINILRIYAALIK